MFQNILVPFDAFRELPTPAHRWLLTCLSRYVNREGRCWPTLRQLAADARMSLSTVQRRMTDMAEMGVFHRARKGVGRYVYQLGDAYRPRWPGRVSGAEHRVSPAATQKQTQVKQKSTDQRQLDKLRSHDDAPWESRLRSWQKTGFWLAWWGPKPDEAGCWAPA